LRSATAQLARAIVPATVRTDGHAPSFFAWPELTALGRAGHGVTADQAGGGDERRGDLSHGK
jgi:hypothetical protein